MRTLTISLFGLALLLSSSTRASTLNEIAELQMQLERAEIQKKLGESRRDAGVSEPSGAGATGGPAGANAPASPPNPAPFLRGVYGLGSRLFAIVDIGGSEVEFKNGDTLLGYRATRIDAHEAVLVGLDSNGAAQRDRVYKLRVTGAGELNALQKLPPLPGVPMAPQSSSSSTRRPATASR
jgi:type IV pilus biogenesis protein PilP